MRILQFDKTVDAKGLACPGPRMNRMGPIRQGHVRQVSEVVLGDEDSNTDIPARM